MRELLLQKVTPRQLGRWLRNAALAIAVVVLLLVLLGWRMFQVRGEVDRIGWPTAMIASEPGDGVTVTWLGTSTLLFDDGETQVLIDGVFTRVPALDILLMRKVRSDVATINYAMATFQMTRLAAIIPAHSHHDHAMDVGDVANRSSAVVLGSESTAMIARGREVPVSQYQVLASGEERRFGEFTIRLIAGVHAPIGPGRQEIFPGIIEQPLSQPARVSDYRTGVAWSVLLSHPRGTTLVQASAGVVEGLLEDVSADVVMLGVAGLAGLGEDYTRRYWRETVSATGASRVIVIHHDDFMAPFGEVRLLPDFLDNVIRTAGWIDSIAGEQERMVSVELPPFGEPIILY